MLFTNILLILSFSKVQHDTHIVSFELSVGTSLISILLTLNLWLSMCCPLMKHNWDYITKSCILYPKSSFITKSNMRLQNWKRSSINSHSLKWIHTKKWLQGSYFCPFPTFSFSFVAWTMGPLNFNSSVIFKFI